MRARTLLTLAITLMLIAALPAVVSAGDRREAPMQWLPATGVAIPGTSVQVNATKDKARVRIKTNGLNDGYAYTVWSFSFSNVGKCNYPDAGLGTKCGPGPGGPGTVPGDDTDPDTGFVVQQVAGHIVGNGDKANFGGSIPVEDAANAEYHFIIADHGPKDPALLPDQIKTPAMPFVQIGFVVPAD